MTYEPVEEDETFPPPSCSYSVNNVVGSAKHVSGMCTKKAPVTLNVLHTASVRYFSEKGSNNTNIVAFQNKSMALRCSALGNPKPQLYIYELYSDGRTSETLNQTVGTTLDLYISQASCDTSGTYVCAAKNNLSTEISERRVDVRVKCRPQLCSESYSDGEFRVLPDTQAVVTLCVLAYPQPNNDVG
ncbi:hypothetical protein PoB_006673000 [Plakobranchus ocellatus]|uniref:Ig-like domain-containing protein n=1 Tax=Plakobranchus ocellatus TaxID=259542 RepID=A0AAV4D7X4_9GAST|nr:hypothetical protein PoB_006673000 [Plakobranchus ocellatus]